MIVFHQVIEKNQQMNKKNLKSDKTLHNPTRTEATTCKKKTESTTKQSHKRTHKKKTIFFNQTKLVLIHNNIFLH